MKALTVAAAALLSLPGAALALREIQEAFGSVPVVKKPGWAEGIVDVANLKSRVYWTSSSGGEDLETDEQYFYKGDTRALNEAIRAFAAVKAKERRLVLLPGPGRTHSFSRTPVDFGWHLHLPPGGAAAVLTVHVDAARSGKAIDRKEAGRWVGELDLDDFATREAASKGLQGLGAAAKPLLREALKAGPPLETRRRVEALLARLPGPDVGDLDVPPGLTVVTPTGLLESGLAGLADPAKRVKAMAVLAEAAPHCDRAVTALSDMLDKGKGEYERRVAAMHLAHLGARAKPALPALKAGQADPDKNVAASFQSAAGQIEKAKDEPGRAEGERRLAILRDLDDWKKARGK